MQKVYRFQRIKIGLFLLLFMSCMIFPMHLDAQTKLTIIPRGSNWLYNDSGDNMGTVWRGKSYVDDLWSDGQAPLGYGNDIVNQNISFGGDAANKIITYYFRKEFIVNNPSIYNSIELELLRDDGALVYLNGSPLLSSNLSDDPDNTTLALSAVGGADETSYLNYSLSSDLLVSGNNVIAVEVHQIDQHSSDLVIDLSLTLSQELPKSVVVSEIMADNHSAYIESDYNQFVDYFELQNITSSAKDLSGYYLSDDPAEPEKWRIPNNTRLDSGEYIVFYADGVDTLMHTSFKLGMKGGSVGLYDWYGRIVDTFNYPQQMTDIAYGREPGNPDQHLYFSDPSPGEDNTGGFISNERAAAPAFSKQGGVFSSPFSIILTSTSVNADIRYTKNGSLPLLDGSHFTSPINITETTVIKARAFEAGKLPSVMVTNSYFINEGINLPIVSVSLEDKYLSDNKIGIYLDANVAERKPWERPATIELFEPDGTRGFVANVDIRLFGRGAIRFPEKSLGILVRHNNGGEYINYQLFPHMEQDYYESFVLRSSSDDWRYTIFRDGMIQSVFQKQTSVNVQSYRPSILFLNGKYMGIHNIRDKYNEAYVAARHGVDPGNIDLLYVDNDFAPPNVEIKAGDIGAYKTLIDFVTSNDMSDDNNYQFAASLVDIDNFIDYICLQVITSNRSWRHNRRIWRPRTPAGKFQYLLFDQDYGYMFLDVNNIDDIAKQDSLFSHLIENDGFKNTFIQRLAAISQTTFKQERVIHYIDSLEAQIEDQIDRHLEKWGGTWPGMITSKSDWRTKVDVMRDFARKHQAIIEKNVKKQFDISGIVSLDLIVDKPHGGEILVENQSITEDAFNGNFYKDIPMTIYARPKAGFKFAYWSGLASPSTETIIPEKSNWKYYDQGSRDGVDWIDQGFDDSSWAYGDGILGYGNNNDTEIGYGGDANNKYVTAYFRHSFNISDPGNYSGLHISLLVDDGAIVYLNSTELVRSNMPTGSISFNTLASSKVSGADETSYVQYSLSSDDLVSGENVIAVEVHQESVQSGDMSFDLKLDANGGDITLDNPYTFTPESDLSITANFSKVANSETVISEIGYLIGQDFGGTQASYFEITNISESSIDIGGYIVQGDIGYVFPNNTMLEANKRIVLCKDASKFGAVPATVLAWASGNLNPSGGTIILKNPAGDIADLVNYDTSGDWPTASELGGCSIELLKLGSDNNEGASWRRSLSPGGTPGIINTVHYSGIRINEFAASATDMGYLEGSDWIELYNAGDEEVNLSGLYLTDNGTYPFKWQFRSGFPESTVIKSGGYVVVTADGKAVKGVLHSSFKLSSEHGTVAIKHGFPGWVSTIDNIDYGIQGSGESFGRFPDGSDNWVRLGETSPMMPNQPVSKYIINPYMVAPGDMMPIFVRVLNDDGSVDMTFEGDKDITASNNADMSPSIIPFKKGVGYLLTKVTANNNFSFQIEDLDDVSYVSVSDHIPRVYLQSEYNADLTLPGGVDYIIEGDLDIGQYGSWTIERGARILIGDKANLWSTGSIQINGSSNQPVVFMPLDPDKPWGGLKIRKGAPDSDFSYAFFVGGGNDPTYEFSSHTNTQAVVRTDQSDLVMNEVYIFDNPGKALGTEFSKISLDNCFFATSAAGPEFRNSQAFVDHTWIMDIPDPDRILDSDDADGVYFWKELSDIAPAQRIQNSVIINTEDDAIDLLRCELEIYNCSFFNIMDKATSAGYRSNVTCENILVANCNRGIVPGWWSNVVVRNSSFYNTYMPAYNQQRGNMEVYNSIFSGFSDDPADFYRDNSLPPSFYYCISDGIDLPGVHNLTGDPKFVDPAHVNYRLQPGSPAIDSGDPSSELDPDGTRKDMGRFPFDGGGIGHLVVNEIYYNPSPDQGKDVDYEFIEIFNPTSENVNISGYAITGGINFYFPVNTWIAAGEYLLLVSNKDTYCDLGCRIFKWSNTKKLSNSGETIDFIDSEGNIITSIIYTSQSPWSVLADGKGYSLELINPGGDNSDPANWKGSSEVFGTPGRINRQIDFDKVRINEILSINDYDLQDETGAYPSWLELNNENDYPVNAAGLVLYDKLGGMNHQIPFSSAPLTEIPAHGFLLFYLDGLPDSGILHTAIVSNTPDGEMTLSRFDQDGSSLIEIDDLAFNGLTENKSFGRYPDGGDSTIKFNNSTPQRSNSLPAKYLYAPRIFTQNEDVPVIIRRMGQDILHTDMENYAENIDFVQQSTTSENIDLNKGFGLIWAHPSNGVGLSIKTDSDSLKVSYDSYKPKITRSDKFSRSEVWTSDHDYYIDQTLSIESYAKLTIEEGTRVFLGVNASIIVNGQLDILGTPDNPVVITSNSDETWGNIRFTGTADASYLSNCIFSHGGSGTSVGKYDAAAVLQSETDLVLDNVLFIENAGKALWMKDSRLEMSNCVIYKCVTGIELENSGVNVRSTFFMDIPGLGNPSPADDQDALCVYGYDASREDDIIIEGCYFYNIGDDAISINADFDTRISDCYMKKPGGIAIDIKQAKARIDYCVIQDAVQGLVARDGSDLDVDHITFHHDETALSLILADINFANPTLVLTNSIFSSSNTDIRNNDNSNISVSYTLSTIGVISGAGNLSGNPLFVDPGISDFRLGVGSRAIDKGDPAFHADGDGTRTDMGRYSASNQVVTNQNIVITEINYAPTNSGSTEFIELFNSGNLTADLSGYTISGAVSFVFPLGQTLKSGDYLVVCKDATIFSGESFASYNWSSGLLPDGPGNILLFNPSGLLLDEVNYDITTDWSSWPNGKGTSLELVDPYADNSIAESWRTSYYIGGTPGEPNNKAPVEGLFINEFVARSYAFYPDENGDISDWIELFNGSDHMVFMDGVSLTRDLANPGMHALSADNDDLLFIAPGGFLVLRADNNPSAGPYHLSFLLSGSGGEIGLHYNNGGGFALLDEVSYTEQVSDISYGRASDGNAVWESFTNPTPGAPNGDVIKVITGLYINEFMARNSRVHENNVGQFDDWIEIYNDNDEAIDLGGLFITDRNTQLDYWQIPGTYPDSTTIPKKGFLMLYPSGKPNLGIQHTNFQLAGHGEYIALSQLHLGQMKIIDEVTYPEQTINISYGRTTDGGLPWVFFNTPTPLRSNGSSSIGEVQQFADNVLIYPNPASETLFVEINLEQAGRVMIWLVDALGEFKTLEAGNNQEYPAGKLTFHLDLKEQGFDTGICFVRVLINNQLLTKRIIISN